MSSSVAKIRIRLGQAEVEIESPPQDMKQTISLIPEVLELLSAEAKGNGGSPVNTVSPQGPATIGGKSSTPPEIALSKSDSLTDILAKIFKEPYGRHPRKLLEVREVLEAYGLAYPKQSVAVTLLRMAQSGKLRRFKDESGEYVYTASISLASGRVHAPDEAKGKLHLVSGAST